MPAAIDYTNLLAPIRDAEHQAQSGAADAVNHHLILRNWLIGAYLIEYKLNGEDRAQYGVRLIERLADDLKSHSLRDLGAMLATCSQSANH